MNKLYRITDLLFNDGHASYETAGKASLQHLLEQLPKHGHLKMTLLDIILAVVQQGLKGQHVQAELGALVQEVLVGPQGQ